MKILVGMSGGVDSSVAALLLKAQGHEVIGATMSIWGKGGMAKNSPHKNACYGPDEKEDIEEARKICNKIGIPFYVFDCVEQYERIVLENFKNEYISGRTPNPCVWCNSLIKFGVLPLIAKENGLNFDKFATGHYARVECIDNKYILKRGVATNKDQSYFLYRLKQEQLENILLPLGTYTKPEIRAIAEKAGLKVAHKPDSQDFYSGDYNELLGINKKEGKIINQNGEILGKHNGIWNYTIGQRKGIGIAAKEPLYVLELNEKTNEVIVGPKSSTLKDTLFANNLSWISKPNIQENNVYTAKIRSTQEPTEVSLSQTDEKTLKVKFNNLQNSISPGQSIVFYDNDLVLGGGIIDSVY